MRAITVSGRNTDDFSLWDKGDGWEHRNKYEFHVACLFSLIKWLSKGLIFTLIYLWKLGSGGSRKVNYNQENKIKIKLLILEHHFRLIVSERWSGYIVSIEVVEGCLWCMEKSEGGWEGKLKGQIKNETTRLSAGISQSQEIQNEGIIIFDTQMRKLRRKATNKLQYLYNILDFIPSHE